MSKSKEILARLFEIAANTPRTYIKVAARDNHILKLWFLTEAIEIYETNPALQKVCKFENINGYYEFNFHNGSAIDLMTYRDPNDAKCGMQEYLLIDAAIQRDIFYNLTIRTRLEYWAV